MKIILIKDSPPQEFKKAEKKKDNKDEENLIENTNNIWRARKRN